MKFTLLIIGFLFLLGGALATPIAFVLGVYEWTAGGMEFKFALWEAVKLWLIMVLLAIFIGIPCTNLGKSDD